MTRPLLSRTHILLGEGRVVNRSYNTNKGGDEGPHKVHLTLGRAGELRRKSKKDSQRRVDLLWIRGVSLKCLARESREVISSQLSSMDNGVET